MMSTTKLFKNMLELKEQYSEGLLSKVEMTVSIKNDCQELIDFEVHKAELVLEAVKKGNIKNP